MQICLAVYLRLRTSQHMDDSCISILVENYYAESILDLSVAMGTLLDKGQARGVESRDVITGREAEVEI